MENPAHPRTHHGLVGMPGLTSPPAAGRAVRHPARPVLGLFSGAGVVLGCWGCFGVLGQELEEEQDGMDQPQAGFDAGWGSEPRLAQDPALRPNRPRETSLNSCPTRRVSRRQRVPAPAGTVTQGLNPAMGYLCLRGSKNPSKCICCLIAARGAGSTEQRQGNAGSQRRSSATRSWRMSGLEQAGRPCHRGAAGSGPLPSHHRTAMQEAAAAREGHLPAPRAANPTSKGNVTEQRPCRRALRRASPAHTRARAQAAPEHVQRSQRAAIRK